MENNENNRFGELTVLHQNVRREKKYTWKYQFGSRG